MLHIIIKQKDGAMCAIDDDGLMKDGQFYRSALLLLCLNITKTKRLRFCNIS